MLPPRECENDGFLAKVPLTKHTKMVDTMTVAEEEVCAKCDFSRAETLACLHILRIQDSQSVIEQCFLNETHTSEQHVNSSWTKDGT